MIDASYFDGQSTRRNPVTVVIHKRVVSIRGDGIHRTIRMSQMEISERLARAPRILRFPDGGFIESDSPELTRMLAQNRYREPWVVRWQNNWPLSLLGLVSLLAMLICGYQWGIPWAAGKATEHLPLALDKQLGEGELALMDASLMKPSKLPLAEQERLRQLFAQLAQPRAEKTSYQLVFRDSRMGPNAFAIPNGVIVMTDQLIKLAESDEAIMGVLTHELGHLQRRHGMRSMLQTLGVATLVNLWMGDVTSLVSAAPAVLLHQKYSRDFEREADQYAIDMMRHNGRSLSPLADLFAKMGDHKSMRALMAKMDEEGDGEDDEAREEEADGEDATPTDYFSSHPSDEERIAKLRAAR
ncbi:MAG: M48 family metallopeptidase [Massilia sp.]